MADWHCPKIVVCLIVTKDDQVGAGNTKHVCRRVRSNTCPRATKKTGIYPSYNVDVFTLWLSFNYWLVVDALLNSGIASFLSSPSVELLLNRRTEQELGRIGQNSCSLRGKCGFIQGLVLRSNAHSRSILSGCCPFWWRMAKIWRIYPWVYL